MKFDLPVNLDNPTRCNGCPCVIWATPKPCWCSYDGFRLERDDENFLVRHERCPLKPVEGK